MNKEEKLKALEVIDNFLCDDCDEFDEKYSQLLE